MFGKFEMEKREIGSGFHILEINTSHFRDRIVELVEKNNTKERIEECLQQDIKIVFNELDLNEPWWRSLDSNRQRVVANMCFNLGYPRFKKFKKFIGAMQVSDWEKAAEEMMDSRWATQVGPRATRLKQRISEDKL